MSTGQNLLFFFFFFFFFTIGSDVGSRDAVRVVDGDRPTRRPCARRACAARRGYLRWTIRVQSTRAWRFVRALNQAGVAVYARADEGDLVAVRPVRRLGVHGIMAIGWISSSIEDVAAVALLDVHDRDLERTAVVVGSDRFAHAVERDLIRRRRRAGTPVAGRVVRIDDEASAARSAGTVYVSAKRRERCAAPRTASAARGQRPRRPLPRAALRPGRRVGATTVRRRAGSAGRLRRSRRQLATRRCWNGVHWSSNLPAPCTRAT